jgi:hypothetical protein
MANIPRRRRAPELNPPAQIVVRVALMLFLFVVVAGLALFLTGCATQRAPQAFAGLACLLLATGGLLALRTWAPGPTATALDFDFVSSIGTVDGDRPVGQLVGLLRQWEELEHGRGSPDFDPWAVQAVRHDIRAVVEADPTLERLFHT